MPVDPDRLSFTTALRAVRRFITSAATATGDILTDLVTAAITQILQDRNQRRDRASPRAVKRPVSPYKSKRNAKPPGSTTVDYTITIIHKGQP